MKYLLYIISIILVLSLSCQMKAQEDKKNMLLKELVKAPHDSTRLKILNELTIATKYHPQVRLYYISQMLKEAEIQKNEFYKCQAYLYHMYLAYNNYDVSAVNYWYSFLSPIATKNKYYDILFDGKRCVVDMLQITGEYEKEEAEALILLKDAEKVGSKVGLIVGNQALGNAYFVTYRYKEAFLAFEKAYQFSLEADNPAVTIEIIHLMISVLQKINEEENWLKYIRFEEACIMDAIKQGNVNFGLQNSLFIMYIHYVDFYLKVEKLEEAGKYYKLAEKSFYASNESGIYEEYFMRIARSYKQAIKQYDEAFMYSDSLLNLLKPISLVTYNEELAVHAHILFAMGRNEEALHCFKMAKNGSDSLQLQILNNQTEQVKNIHNVYLLELENEKNKNYLQLTILVFLILSILTVIGFIIYTNRSRKKLERDEAEVRKMAHEVELANQAKERFLSNVSNSIGKPLDTVVNYSLLLASDQNIDDNQRLLISETINKTSADLLQLINNILDLSRLEAGMMRFLLSDIEVFSLMNDCAIGISIEQKRKINITFPQSALFLSHIDGSRLLSVFNNLFVSALSDNELQVLAVVNEAGTDLMIKVFGTSFAVSELSQDQIIRNEINRMIISYFKGVYEIKTDTPTPYVYFTIKGQFTPVEAI